MKTLAFFLVYILLSNNALADGVVIDSYTIKGNGNQTVCDIKINVKYSRFVGHGEKGTKITCYDENGKYTYYYLIQGQEVISKIVVETQGDWYIDFSPIGFMATPSVSGHGSYYSDFFMIDKPTIVSIKADGGENGIDSFGVSLYYVDKEGKIRLADPGFIDCDSYPLSTVYIALPDEDAVAWLWHIGCFDNVEWSITAK